jgi:GTP-binding protein Era
MLTPFARPGLSAAVSIPRFLQQTVRQVRNKPIFNPGKAGSEKSLDIVILGAPNVGKSAMLNSLTGAHVAAMTRKGHTTRREILGVFNHRNTQLAFYDTPGFISAQSTPTKHHTELRETTTDAVNDVDIVLVVVDAARRLHNTYDFEFAEMCKLAYAGAKKEVILVLNKVDIVEPKDRLLDVTEKYVSLMNGVRHGPDGGHLAELDVTTFMISAVKNDGVIDLKNYLLTVSEYRPWVLPKEKGATDQTDFELVREIVYEKFLENVHDEIPFVSEVECIAIEDMGPDRLKIFVDIRVNSGKQQKIVIGQQGRTMLKLRQSACKMLEAILHKNVILVFDIQVRNPK